MSNSLRYLLQNVSKSPGDSFTLRIDRLEIFAGEVLCLLGPNGAGKTTLLRSLSGLESAAGGNVQYNNYRFNGQGTPLAIQRQITQVFQRPILLTGTVRFNVEYALRLRGELKCASRVQAVLDRLGLTGIAAQSARNLSGGEAQLVALARALVIEPDVLLLDEPTSNLDPARVTLVEQVITDVQRQRGMTVVWTTHNLFQARRVAHRIGLLLNGQLVEVAPTQTFFGAPSDPRTAAFVQGKMVY